MFDPPTLRFLTLAGQMELHSHLVSERNRVETMLWLKLVPKALYIASKLLIFISGFEAKAQGTPKIKVFGGRSSVWNMSGMCLSVSGGCLRESGIGFGSLKVISIKKT